jgi:beta-lactamase regulating signal transducer with metallopeptidase domain/tetratricopeptide (TPR) repeat protein
MTSALMGSRPWLAAGWTMLHFLWVGCAAGLLAAAARRALRTATPEARYATSLLFLATLAMAPAVIAWRLAAVEPGAPPPASTLFPPRILDQPPLIAAPASVPASPARPIVPPRPLEAVVGYLPWCWLAGSPLTFALMAAGLVGAERLRRRSRPLGAGEAAVLCRRLAEALRISRRVALGVCDRVATPVLVGIVRPMILLPPAALAGWSVDQLEMVLLHELAHLRRWDNLVNLLQRIVEAVLFFHPVVWWVSAWARREREHCCDGVVVAHTGRRRPYADLLVALAGPRPAPPAAVALAEHPVVSRVRQILNPEAPSMKLSRTVIAALAGLMIVPAVWVGVSASAFGRHDNQPPSPDGKPDAGPSDDEVLRRALELVSRTAQPDDVHALRSLARVQAEAGDRAAAMATLKRAVAVADRSPKADSKAFGLIFVARSLSARGDKAGAQETLRRAIEAAPAIAGPVEKVAALSFAAQVQAETGDRAAAEQTFAQALDLQRTLPDRDPNGSNFNLRLTARLRILDALVEVGEVDKALDILAVDPDSVDGGLDSIIRGALKLKDRARARAILERLLGLTGASRYPGVRGHGRESIAEAQAKLGDFDAALGNARRIDEGDPFLTLPYLPVALIAIAKAQAAAGRHDDARALLREALEKSTERHDVGGAGCAQSVAEAQAEIGDLEGATRSLEAIGDDFPSWKATAWIAIAEARVKANDRAAAEAALRQAAEAADRIGPRADIGNFDAAWHRSIAYRRIAETQAKLGDFDAALRTLRDRVGDEFSERANGLNEVVDLQIAAGDLKGALRTTRALKIDAFRAGVSAEAVARAQAKAGDAAGVLAWSESLAPPYVQARALVGMIRGLAERKQAERRPVAAPKP